MAIVQKIAPCLWFDHQAEEAANYYVSIFKNSGIDEIARYGKEGFEIHQRPTGSVMTVTFRLERQKFIALNGGPRFKFNEAVSFVIDCKDQEEVDYYWSKLTANGGVESQCGWLKDKFGLSWQVVPGRIGELVSHPKAMQAMMGMKKLSIAELEQAAKS